MAEKLVMLALSPTMETGTIVKWSRTEGDTIASGDVLCEVETDKTTMEYETINEGTILKILVEEGGQVKVGDPIAIVGEEGEDISGLLEEVSKEGGEQKGAEAPAAPTPGAGEAAEKPGTQAPAATPTGAPKPQAPAPEKAAEARPETGMPPGGVPASPLARKIAQDKGIDLRNISGSGPGGRVVKADVEAAAAAGPAAAGPSPTPAPVAAPVAGESLPISDKRRIIAQRLSESFYTAPHFFLRVVVDVEKFLDARARWNEGREKRLGLNSFLMKFTTQALLRHPEVNASWQADAIVRHGAVHIGLAVAQPDGLITPTVKNCERKGIEAIDTEINALVAKARENRLSPEEYTGSTFTISNLGSFGVRDFTAIINPPNAAILAVGEVVKQPVVGAQDTIEIRRQMTLTLSGDHRILDGAVAARFMADLRAMLEDPVRALL